MNLAKAMTKVFDQFPLEVVNKVCDKHGDINGFNILLKRLTKKKRQQIVDEVEAEENNQRKGHTHG